MELNPREKKMLQSPVDEAKYFYVWTLVRDVAHLLEKARDRELRPHGITVMQATVLHMIRMLGEEATPVALARVMFREAPTISSVLGRLEEQGLILKKRQGRRGGAIRLTLTPDGESDFTFDPEQGGGEQPKRPGAPAANPKTRFGGVGDWSRNPGNFLAADSKRKDKRCTQEDVYVCRRSTGTFASFEEARPGLRVATWVALLGAAGWAAYAASRR